MGGESKKTFLQELQYRYDTKGIKPTAKWAIQSVFAKLAGVNECKAQIDTLHYFLNHYVDIRKFPKATGPLRQLQEADTALLRLFHEICVRNHLTYWVDAGTILGAVRHGGFIPWDDDTDVVMPRADYNRAREILKKEFAVYGIQAEEPAGDILQRIGIGYKHEETGVWMDVLPVDEYLSAEPLERIRDDLYKKLHTCRQYYFKNHQKMNEVAFDNYKKRIISFDTNLEKENHVILYHAPETFISKWFVYEKEIVYPLRLIKFEDIQLYAPGDSEAYCIMFFGNYMDFPKNGTEHHGEGVRLSSWSSLSGVDMEAVKVELGKAYQDYIKK